MFLVLKHGQRAEHAADIAFPVHKVAGDVPAVKHQVGIVKLCQLRFLLGERLNDRLLRVVNQHEDVRQLNGCALADLEPWRNAGNNRPLRRANQRGRSLGIVIRFKVEREDEPRAHHAADRACHQHKPLRLLFENALVEVLAHMRFDALDALRFTGLFQICFRQNQLQRRRCFADDSLGFLPVFRLGGELVAGDDRPFGIVRALFRQQDARHLHRYIILKTLFHKTSILRNVQTSLCALLSPSPGRSSEKRRTPAVF